MYKIIIILLFFSLNSCNGQESEKTESKRKTESKKKEFTMERFDIDKFNRNQQNNVWTYIDEDGNSVRATKNESMVFENNEYTTKTKMDGYTIEVKTKKSPFNINKNFHANGFLKMIGTSFHNGFLKGIWKEYNEKGEFIKEVDYDIPYKSYPWEKVEQFLLSKKVDLMDPLTNVFRELNDQNIPTWYLDWDTGKKNASMFQIIENVEIDAKTGKIIKEYQTFREP